AAVLAAGVGDGGAARIGGFRYLRTDRFLASFRNESLSPAQFRFWVDRLATLDGQARGNELANLPSETMRSLRAEFSERGRAAPIEASLDQCRRSLIAADHGDPARAVALRERVQVPDDYSQVRRFFGGYTLTKYPFAVGIRRWQDATSAVHATPLERLPIRGELVRYSPSDEPPAPHSEVTQILAAASANPLGLPLPDAVQLNRLAATFAPILEVDVATDDDRIGHPRWAAPAKIRVDTTNARLFVRTAHTRLGDRTLLQLEYTAWFGARPASFALDPLSGTLDGVTWRVTIGADGAPILFDSIHPCGCYHLFFPTERARERPTPPGPEEFVFVPRTLERSPPGARVVVRIAARTHYIDQVRFETTSVRPGVLYALEPYDRLTSLPLPIGDRASLFGPDGIVAGTQRLERWLFWPMGIVAPGSMRQAGRHATAFVGRRHFDDPRLIDERFIVN
ncbi:MAG: hypothetical protein ABIU95_14650, partial [Burkholderiales bacterium]